MSVKVKIEMTPTQEILLKRTLNKDGGVQQFFTHEVRRQCDPYVPMDNGPLKNTAQEYSDKIVYPQPYAQKQYYENKGNGLRGQVWDKRMWSDRGDEIVEAVARKAGGKAK